MKNLKYLLLLSDSVCFGPQVSQCIKCNFSLLLQVGSLEKGFQVWFPCWQT
uniref:Uncharacterized protein n=1 Tax=Rhizophora mucronata TaxID=61149 RepID=A0A2P2PHX0_RHIMU